MNTHYTKDDVVELASVIFVNDINSDTVAASDIETKDIAEASFYAAEVFFMKAAAYHRGELDQTLDDCHSCGQCSAPEPEPEDQRKAERRSNVDRRGIQQKGCSETSAEEDEAFTKLEQALKEQFLAATLHSIMRNAAKV